MKSNTGRWMTGLLGVWIGVLMVVGCGQPTDESGEQALMGAPLWAAQSRVRLAAGGSHSLSLRPDGTVWAVGANGLGQLGDGTTSNHSAPVQVQGLSGVVAVAAGSSHSFEVRSDSTVWAWGDNSHGQLGDGTTSNRSVPVQVQGLSGVVAVAAGSHHSLAVRSDGTVWAWGYNSDGQLGNGAALSTTTAIRSLL
ncbi:hypothetical protein JRI60_43695 [Archangium violaceum]|nr:hypothetical protein [Archangium violaceum]QRN95880.1 hypothetical protein JRI60_43695 [Archangium violaceum]